MLHGGVAPSVRTQFKRQSGKLPASVKASAARSCNQFHSNAPALPAACKVSVFYFCKAKNYTARNNSAVSYKLKGILLLFSFIACYTRVASFITYLKFLLSSVYFVLHTLQAQKYINCNIISSITSKLIIRLPPNF